MCRKIINIGKCCQISEWIGFGNPRRLFPFVHPDILCCLIVKVPPFPGDRHSVTCILSWSRRQQSLILPFSTTCHSHVPDHFLLQRGVTVMFNGSSVLTAINLNSCGLLHIMFIRFDHPSLSLHNRKVSQDENNTPQSMIMSPAKQIFQIGWTAFDSDLFYF